MPRSKRITRIFAAFWKTAEAAIGAQGREIPETPRQDLVYIGLMAYIPDNFVTGNRKDTVQGNGQFNNTQVRRQMSTVFETTSIMRLRISAHS